MLTAFGKLCRKIRIDCGEIMRDMSEKLGVTPAFLSAVENGNKNIPGAWKEKLIELYSLNEQQSKE